MGHTLIMNVDGLKKVAFVRFQERRTHRQTNGCVHSGHPLFPCTYFYICVYLL